jgi:hypothetical protein
VLFDILDVSFRSGLRLPAELTLLAKALFNLDGVTRALGTAGFIVAAALALYIVLAIMVSDRKRDAPH